MASKLPTYHGFTETEFVGLYFCLFERPEGLFFGIAPMTTGTPDYLPLEKYEQVARALKAFRRGDGLSKLSATNAIKPPLAKRKWKVKSYAVDDYAEVVVSKVTTATGDLVGWFVAVPLANSEYVALHEPKHCPAVYGGDERDGIDSQAAVEWEHICGFRNVWDSITAPGTESPKK